MNPLIQKMRAARESRVDVGKWNFTIVRPTRIDLGNLGRGPDGRIITMELLKFVVGWNVQEIDIVPGGTGVDVPFDAETFAEWVKDHDEVVIPLVAAIDKAYDDHEKARGEAEKNS